MKFHKSIFILVIHCFFFSNCLLSQTQILIPNKLSSDKGVNTKGIKKITEKSCLRLNAKGEVEKMTHIISDQCTTIEIFNKKGNILSKEKIANSPIMSESVFTTLYEYKEDIHLIKRSILKDDVETIKYTAEYNENGERISSQYYDRDGNPESEFTITWKDSSDCKIKTVRKVHPNKYVISEDYYNNHMKLFLQKKYKSGALVREIIYTSRDTFKNQTMTSVKTIYHENNINAIKTMTSEHFYNSKGVMLLNHLYRDNEFVSAEKYYYNDHKDIEKTEFFDADYNFLEASLKDYEYDDRGNWIRKISQAELTRNDATYPISVVLRDIEYYE